MAGPALTVVKSEPLTVVQSVPAGSERTRQDTNAIGVDHEKLQQSISNWASTLPRSLQAPAAMLATFPADVLASLAEMFSAPESVATMPGAMKATNAVLDATGSAVKAAPKAAVRGVAAVGDAIHPDVIGAVSPRAGKVVEIAQRMRAKLPEPAATDAAVPVAPAASVPAAPAPLPVPAARTAAAESTAAHPPSGPPPPVTLPEGTTVPPATAQYYPQKFLNEVAIRARREGLTLSDGEYAVAHGLTQQGATPAEAVRQIAAARSAAVPSTAAAVTPEKLKLVGLEQKEYLQEYLRLRNTGLTHQQAEDLMKSQRTLSGSLNLPSGETVRRSVKDRNATGRWESDK